MHGFRNKKLRLALLTAVLVVASFAVARAALGGGGGGGVIITCPTPTATFTSITMHCTTNVATKLSVSESTDGVYWVPKPDNPFRAVHNVTVNGLSPNTPYFVKATATAKNGATKTSPRYKLPTAAPGSAPATVTSSGNKLLLNGQPFFAFVHFIVECPNASLAADAATLGANVVTSSGLSCPSPGLSPTERAQQLHAVLNNQNNRLWLWSNQLSETQALQGLLPELLNGQPAVMNTWRQTVIEDVCSTTTKLYSSILNASANTHVIYSISISTSPHRAGEVWCLSAQSLDMAFWTMVAAHGKGIEYNTADAGNSSSFDVRKDLITQAAKQAKEFATVGPVVLTGKPISLPSATAIKFGEWQYGGLYYVLAQNTTNTATSTGTFTLSSLNKGGTAQVMFTGGSLKIKSGVVPVTLAPGAHKWFKITPNK